MPQFSVHRNPNPATRAGVPYLLDVQHDCWRTWPPGWWCPSAPPMPCRAN